MSIRLADKKIEGSFTIKVVPLDGCLIMKMKISTFALTLTVLLLGRLTNAQELTGETSCDSFTCDAIPVANVRMPTWWISSDALFLHRTQHNRSILVIDENNSMAPIRTGSDLSFGMAAGPRLATGWTSPSGCTAELVYFGMNNWASSVNSIGDNNLSIPGDLGLATFDFFSADRMDITYDSRIQNVEANLWSSLAGVEWLTGFRHFSVIEDFMIASFDVDTYKSDYQIQTNNQLYGGQIGVRNRWGGDRLNFAPEAKFALLGNHNNQHSLVRDLDNSKVLRDVTESSSILSSLAELRLLGKAAVTSNLDLTFGYNFIWLTGVVQAPYQLDFTYTDESSRFVDDNHSILYHGANAGLNWCW
jgi:hypothetical protein